MVKILLKLYNHTNEALHKKEMDTVEKNIELIKDLFGIALSDSISLTNSRIFYDFIKCINDIGLRMLNEGLFQDTMKFINEIYGIYNKGNNKGTLNIFNVDVFRKLNNFIENQHNYKSISDLRIKELLFNLIRNSGESNGFIIDNYAPAMYSAFYWSIYNNKYINDNEKTKLINEVLEDTTNYGYYIDINNDKNKMEVLLRSILSLLKSMIDKLDFKRLSYSLLKILNNLHHYSNVINIHKLLMCVIIYLYYLAYKEETKIVSQNDKEMYVNYLRGEEVKVFYNVLKSYSYGMWNYFLEIKSELGKWERHSDGEAKRLMMEYVVKDFFLFFSIASGDFNIDKINKDSNVISELDIFSFLDAYLDGDGFKKDLTEQYSIFVETFNFNRGNIDYDISVLKNQLVSSYKSIEFEKIRRLINNKEVINYNMEIIRKSLKNVLYDSPYIRLANSSNKKAKIKMEKEFRLIFHLSTYFIADKKESEYEYFENSFNKELENHILASLRESGFIYKQQAYADTNKIDNLLEVVGYIQNEKGININAFISGIPIDSHILYRESESHKQKLNKLFDGIQNMEKTDKLAWIGFNENNTSLQISEIIIEGGHISDQEVNEALVQCKKGEKYSINITNNIFVPFTQEEAIDYLKIKSFVIRIKIKYSVLLEELESGFIIETVFDKV